jgi:hypothetical protein
MRKEMIRQFDCRNRLLTDVNLLINKSKDLCPFSIMQKETPTSNEIHTSYGYTKYAVTK